MKKSSNLTAAVALLLALMTLGAQSASFSWSFDTGYQDQSGAVGQTIHYYGTLTFTGDVPSDYFNLSSWANSWITGGGTSFNVTHDNFSLPKTLTSGTSYPGLDIMDVEILSSPTPSEQWGTVELLGRVNEQLSGFQAVEKNFSITVVPEPYEYGLVAVLGLLGLGTYHRFARKEV